MGYTGPPGFSFSNVSTIKLCADYTSEYPEYAICINNQLYAVYQGSTPNTPSAFLALIVPGSYVSTGGNGCRFTAASDGSIKEQ